MAAAANFCRKASSSISGPPASACSAPARVRSLSRATRSPGADPPPRSNSKRYLATVQPLFSSPRRPEAGTRTLSKKTWFTSWSPARVMIGRTLIPGLSISSSRKVIPCCGLPSRWVRTRQNMRLAKWAWVVQIFEPDRT